MSKQFKIDLITGSYPPMRCGVGDYSYHLSKALRSRHIDVDVYTSTNARLHNRHGYLHAIVTKWSMWRMFVLARNMFRTTSRFVHIQYPTIGYGYHVGPQFLLILLRCFNIKVITTIHEFQLTRLLRRISLFPFLFWSNILIFTSDEEKAAVVERYPWMHERIRRSSHVIPVGSNIPLLVNTVVPMPPEPVVSFFGLFYPGRRIELVIKAFNEARKKHPGLKFRFIGDVHPRHSGYFLKIKDLAEQVLPQKQVEWVLGRTPEEIAYALRQSSICVLPFPDGASYRRTTLIASLSLGVPTITTRGKRTPDQLVDGQNVLFADDEVTIAAMIDRLLIDRDLWTRLSTESKKLSNIFSWEQIAAQHINVYQNKDTCSATESREQ